MRLMATIVLGNDGYSLAPCVRLNQGTLAAILTASVCQRHARACVCSFLVDSQPKNHHVVLHAHSTCNSWQLPWSPSGGF